MLINFILLSFFVGFGSFTCFNGGIEYQSKCYYFNGKATGFAAAEVYCNGLGGHLASVHDGFANTVIGRLFMLTREEEARNYFNQSTGTDIWIGSSNLISNGKWNWSDGTSFNYNNWKQGEPQNIGDSNCTALALKDGTWSSHDCFQTKHFACAVPFPAYPLEYNCSAGWMYYPPTGSCYSMNLGRFNGTWSEAEQHCQYLGGAHLASIHSVAELQLVMSYGVATSINIMTGIYTNDSGQTWETTDGTKADFLNYGGWCSVKSALIKAAEKDVKRCIAIGLQFETCYFPSLCGQMPFQTMCKKTIS